MVNIKVYKIIRIPRIKPPIFFDFKIAVVYPVTNSKVSIDAKRYDKLNLMCSLSASSKE